MGTHGGKNWGYPGNAKRKRKKLDRAAGMQEGGREMEGRGLIGRGWMAGGIRRLGFIFDKEEFLTLIECVKNKRRNYFLKIYPDGQSCGNFGKKKLRKLQRNKIRYF